MENVNPFILTNEDLQLVGKFINSGIADSTFVSELQSSYEKQQQRLWEAVLYDYLHTACGLSVKSNGDEGPDFYVDYDDRKIHIEAIAPRFYNVINKFNDVEDFETGIYNPDKYLERWSGAFIEKFNKFDSYLKQDIVSSNDIQIIAISNTTSEDSMGFYNLPPEKKYPVINEYLYPLTMSTLVLSKNGCCSFSNRESYQKPDKPSSNPVPVGVFIKNEFKNISAILVHDYRCTKDWVLVHNVNAVNPLPTYFFPSDAEWAPRCNDLDHQVYTMVDLSAERNNQ